jgi:hypothetical protein
MRILKQLFQSKYKNRIINKIDELTKEHNLLVSQTKSTKYSNTKIWVDAIIKRSILLKDIELLKSLLN